MTPTILLSHWRQRWGKADVGTLLRPRLSGGLHAWGDAFAESNLWRVPGLGLLSLSLFMALTMLLTTLHFTLVNQWVLSFFLLLLSLLIRSYQSVWITWMLLGFALINSSRYVFWRLDQTLGSFTDTGFWVVTCLFAAELVYIALILLDVMHKLMPLSQPQTSLPTEVIEWPTVGVFVVCSGHNLSGIEDSLNAMAAISWPRLKITLYFVDAVVRKDVRKFLNEHNAVYLAYPEEKRDVPGLLNQALMDSKEEFSVMVSMGDIPARNVLVTHLGCFDADPLLGILTTQNHFLTPALGPHFDARFGAASASGGDFMVVRRAMLLAVGGLPCEPATSHIVLSMQNAGLKHACVIHESTQTLCYIMQPFKVGYLQLRWHISWLRSALETCLPLLGLIFYVTPALYFLADTPPVKATVPVLLAYALPHLIQAFLLHHRLHQPRYLPFWAEMRDVFLSLHILVLTALTVTLTKIGRVIHAFQVKIPRLPGQVVWPLTVIDTLVGMVLGVSVVRCIDTLQLTDLSAQIQTVFYGTWSCFVLMLLAAKLAVVEDAQQIRLQKQLQMQMPAMIKMSNNRTMTCSTTNFPQTHLELVVPTAQRLNPGECVNLSIFHHHDECVFQASVLSKEASLVCLGIEDDFIEAYNSFASAVFARRDDWPQWLPDHDADKLIPDWLAGAVYWPLQALMRFWARMEKKLKPPATAKIASQRKNTT